MSDEKEDSRSETLSNGDDMRIILDYIQHCPAVFQSQQIGDPDLSKEDKRRIAENILVNKPVQFLAKFGKYLEEDHLNLMLKRNDASYEVKYYVDNLKKSLGAHNRNKLKRNRRYEAMKRLEANGTYFNDVEMEEREPVLYYQMVGQYLSNAEKQKKHRETHKNTIPSFTNFLLEKLEKDELNEAILEAQNEENTCRISELSARKNENSSNDQQERRKNKKWGCDWEDENFIKENKSKCSIRPSQQLGSQEKAMLYEEFKSIMQNKFISGQDTNFDYSDVDSNSDYDCVEIRGQDEEEKYFDEETCNGDDVCTDTGIQDY